MSVDDFSPTSCAGAGIARGWGGSGPGTMLLYIFLQCPTYGTVSIQKRIVLKAGHWGLGEKSPTLVGE